MPSIVPRLLSTALLLALLVMDVRGQAPARHDGTPAIQGLSAGSFLTLMASQALAAPLALTMAAPAGDQTLNDLATKKANKAQAQLAKLTKKKVKVDAKLAAVTLKLSGFQLALTPLLIEEPAAIAAFALATQALVDALALPMETPEEKAARKLAVKQAKKAKSLAKKTLKQTQKRIARLQKKINKAQLKVDALGAKSAGLAATIASLNDVIDVLGTPFDFQLSKSVAASVRVQDTSGMPIPYARIVWTDVLLLPPEPIGNQQPVDIEELESPAVYGQAFTDEDGRVEIGLEIPVHLQAVDMSVLAAGYIGPFTDEGLRELWDVFAPSARVAVQRDELADFTITLAVDDEDS